MYYSEKDLTFAKYGVVKEKKYDIAILPWGATEPHGPHIPYGTDTVITSALESLRDGYGWLPRHWDKATVDTAVGCAKNASAESADAYLAEIMPKIVQLVVELATQELY